MQPPDGPLIRVAVLSNLLADALGEVDLAPEELAEQLRDLRGRAEEELAQIESLR
jgi:hypothetical protein